MDPRGGTPRPGPSPAEGMRFTPCDAAPDTRRRATTTEQYRLSQSHRYQGARSVFDVSDLRPQTTRVSAIITRAPTCRSCWHWQRLRIAAGVARSAGPHVMQFVLGRGLRGGTLAIFAATLERGQRGDHHRRPVDEEVPPGGLPGVGETEPVGPQRDVVAGHPWSDLVLHRPLPVAGRDHRARGAGQCLGDVPVSYTHLTLPTKRIV